MASMAAETNLWSVVRVPGFHCKRRPFKRMDEAGKEVSPYFRVSLDLSISEFLLYTLQDETDALR